LIRGILFDKDGTLFDFKATWSAWSLALLDRLSGESEVLRKRLAEAIGFIPETRDFLEESPVIAGTPREIAEVLAAHLPGSDVVSLTERLNALAAQAEMREAVPLAPLLGALKARGLRLGLATNDSEAPARAHLASAGVEALFDFVAGFDSGHGAKPAPGMLLAFADRMGFRPGEVAMVGDTSHDLIAARAAGMRAVGVLTGLSGKDDLTPFAETVLPDIGHLPDWIARAAPLPAA
jgi:phosphoglycolate phosphatase